MHRKQVSDIQVLLNLFIALIWVLMVDEDQIYISTFVKGYLIGIVIIYIMHRFLGTKFYLFKVISLIKLLLLFNIELFTSSMSTLYYILFASKKVSPGLVTYSTELQEEWQLTCLIVLIILTPRSIVLRVSHDNKMLFIHTLHSKDSEMKKLYHSIKRYEKVLIEVSQK
ncbi:Na+/H+ antiporter subunit E [Macrococcoides canis]|uniref:Na+/H+ antiporter subunit E n=1 Tax=Macrococcoides canis TaxID=1855823 RepID=UPI0022062E32|nr:Na+/H+ antiporter subunit E [Macrococcus canis]UTH03537.1 Na+/H+ antiporter subunit E [Macrococcus canis]